MPTINIKNVLIAIFVVALIALLVDYLIYIQKCKKASSLQTFIQQECSCDWNGYFKNFMKNPKIYCETIV